MPIIIKNNSNQDILDIVTAKLLKNDLVSLPTETVYGLAGLGTSLSAAKKIYKLKKRPLSKKLIFHCSNIDMVKKFFILLADLKFASRLLGRFYGLGKAKIVFCIPIAHMCRV